eukprot:2143333-Pleurochrysis_carterae.AAC.1
MPLLRVQARHRAHRRSTRARRAARRLWTAAPRSSADASTSSGLPKPQSLALLPVRAQVHANADTVGTGLLMKHVYDCCDLGTRSACESRLCIRTLPCVHMHPCERLRADAHQSCRVYGCV